MNATNDTLIALVSEIDPTLGEERVDPDRGERVRQRVITELGGDPLERTTVAGFRRRHRLALGLGGVAVAAIIAAVTVALLGGGSVAPSPSPAFAESAIRVAEANPRLLVGAPGWKVENADEFEVDQGQMDFTNGADTLNVAWMPAGYYTEPDIQELRQGARGPEGTMGNPITPGPGEPEERFEWITALDRRALFDYDAGGSFYRLTFAPENGSFLTIGGYSKHDSMSRAQFFAVVDSMYAADVDTWLAALPPEIVRPVDNGKTVDEMLAGIPVPATVNVDELRSMDLALSRYQIGAKVTGAVACGWLDQWAAAVRAGDAHAAQEAVEAMSTSHDWAILREMENQGGWSQVVWEYSREMQNDNRGALLGIAGTETTPDGRVYELSPSYATGLGCDSEQRTLRDE